MPDHRNIQISLHIGAHKTATSHLQHAIHAFRDDILTDGVRFLGPQRLRGDHPSLTERLGLPRSGGQEVDAKIVASNLNALVDGVDRLVISEENFIGTLTNQNHKIRKPLYPNAADRISQLAAIIAPKGVDVFLSIRNPAGYLNSAYGQYLRAGGRGRPEEFVEENPLNRVNWAKLLQRLEQVSGIRSIIVWPFEDYEPLYSRILSLMLGATAASRIGWSPDTVNEGLSKATVSRLLAGDDHPMRASELSDSEEQIKFDIYNGTEHAKSGMFYADQLEEIAAMRHVHLLRV